MLHFRCFVFLLFGFWFSIHTLSAQSFLAYDGRAFFTSFKDMFVLEAFSERLMTKYSPRDRSVKMRVLITSFSFTNCSKTVEKTFNDIYMESHKYHWAEFNGVLSDSVSLQKEGEYQMKVTGILKIKNTQKQLESPVTIKVNSKSILMETRFKLSLADFQINILTNDLHWLSDKIEVYVSSTLPNKPTFTSNK